MSKPVEVQGVAIQTQDRGSGWPLVTVFVDRVPKLSEYRFEERDGNYRAERDGLVSFLAYQGPGEGFGGAVFPVTMTDGSERKLLGPWSSRSSVVNPAFPDRSPCVEVILEDAAGMRWSGAVTVETLRDALAKFEEGWVLETREYVRGEFHYEARRADRGFFADDPEGYR